MPDSTSAGPTHPDPAVQALIDQNWLVAFDGLTLDDLVNAVRVVRDADLRHAGTRICTQYQGDKTREVWRLPGGAELTTPWELSPRKAG